MAICTMDTREGHFGVTCVNGVICSGAEVASVHPKDLFAKHKIYAGSVIRKINGQTIGSHDDAMDELNAAKAKGEKVAIVYLTPDEAKAQGKIESAQARKCVMIFLGVVVALIMLLVGATKFGLISMPEKPEKPPKDGPTIPDNFFDGMPADSPLRGLGDTLKDTPDDKVGEVNGMLKQISEMKKLMTPEYIAQMKAKYGVKDEAAPAATWSAPDPNP